MIDRSPSRRRLYHVVIAVCLLVAAACEEEAETARTEALAAAMAEVDAWYDSEIPAFLEALSAAKTPAAVSEAWTAFADKTALINLDLPERTPEEVRPALRDYLFQRYNDSFPALQDSLAKKMSEISRKL